MGGARLTCAHAGLTRRVRLDGGLPTLAHVGVLAANCIELSLQRSEREVVADLEHRRDYRPGVGLRVKGLHSATGPLDNRNSVELLQ